MNDTWRRTLIRCGLILLGVVVFLAGSFRYFASARENARSSSCQSNLKQIMLGIQQYVKDYDQRFPLVRSSNLSPGTSPYRDAYGWADALQPYLKSVCIYQCPSDPFSPSEVGKSTIGGYTDYWYNGNLDRLPTKNLNLTNIITLGDGNGDKSSNARFSRTTPLGQELVESGYERKTSAWHHMGGANFAFGDGHVKWLRPEDVSVKSGDQYTFAPR